ncbi:MAG TPA: HAMP domain-containing histidine kinase [bacterium]|nr:HAMP domain-containing histidine kinase [bacterium]
MVTDSSGTILAHTDVELFLAGEKDSSLQTNTYSEQRYINESGKDILALTQPVSVLGETAGFARVSFSAAAVEAGVNKILSQTANRILFVGMGVLVIGVIAALLLTRSITNPLMRLEEGAVRIGKGRLNEPIKAGSNDELGSLARKFNEMAVQLEELDRMKSDFVSGITHELRSPLTSLDLYLTLFDKGAAGPINAKGKEYFEIMHRNVTRLRKFIDTLLDISKIERGKMELDAASVDVKPVVDEIIKLFGPQAGEQEVDLSVNLPECLPKIHADPDRLIQILTNLTSNALKFTKPKGSVTISVKPVPDGMLFGVSDSGIGIPKKDIDRIFNKFEQVKSSSTDIGGTIKGTGLGLAIVKNLVDLHGGRIWAESREGEGSTFFFTVPLAEQRGAGV